MNKFNLIILCIVLLACNQQKAKNEAQEDLITDQVESTNQAKEKSLNDTLRNDQSKKLDAASNSTLDFFDGTKQFQLITFKRYSDSPSSDTDTSYCAPWSLDESDIIKILQETQPIDGPDWHHLYSHLPCVYRGEIQQNETSYEFAINGGSWLYIFGQDTTMRYGDVNGSLSHLFLDTVWNPEEDNE